MTRTMTLRIGHSPDPDDAFMFYALAKEVEGTGLAVEHVLEDIESLNRRAETAEREVTAVSAASYPRVAARYFVMRTGASLGRYPVCTSTHRCDLSSTSATRTSRSRGTTPIPTSRRLSRYEGLHHRRRGRERSHRSR